MITKSKIIESIKNRLEFVSKEKQECMDVYHLQSEENKRITECLNMVYGMEIKFLTDLIVQKKQ